MIIHHLATTNSLQGTLAEMLGIALADLRLRNDAFRKGHANGVIASRSEAKGSQGRFEGNTHHADCFAVELVAVEVRSDRHEDGR